jgi:predicted acyl esterase
LAWFDHWLKGQDTGILEGPMFRYIVPGADGWRATEQWPVPNAKHQAFALSADGTLSAERESSSGSRAMLTLGAGTQRAQASETDPPSFLVWTSPVLEHELDVVGDIELLLDATTTAPDTAWIVTLQDVGSDGIVTDITAGFLRAGMREVSESTSRIGAPDLPCRSFQPVPIGQPVHYRIPLVANARRFQAGHRLRLFLTSDDQDANTPAMLGYRHASVGNSCLSKIASSSRLLLPIVPPARQSAT